MRALFACTPNYGTFLPLTPIARAMVDAGHDVAFGTPTFHRESVEAAGFRWVRAGVDDDAPEMVAAFARRLELHGRERLRFSYQQIFAGIRPRHLVPDLLALAETWRPDLFVNDCTEFGAMIAAELLETPHATVEVHAAGELPAKLAFLSDPVQQLRRQFGLREIPEPVVHDRYLVLRPFPAVLNAPEHPIPPTAHHLHAVPRDTGDVLLPRWVDRLGSRPLVYVSLGTVFNPSGMEIFATLLAGLRDLDAEIVLTIGQALDPAAFGPQPAHVHVERYLPLGALLPRCSLVVFHGGSGTLSHTVAHGLPMVIVPLAADQPENAARCSELGAARTLDRDQLTPAHVREVVLDVLHTPSYRESAGHLRDAFNSLPGPRFAVELLERLARDKTPIIASQ